MRQLPGNPPVCRGTCPGTGKAARCPVRKGDLSVTRVDDLTLPTGFFTDHWRRRPVLIPGGARSFLPTAPTRDDILGAAARGRVCATDSRTVWFLEAVTDGFPGVADLVASARDLFEWHDIWCDLFVTAGPSSIGSHYDSSDNFTIGVEGAKHWRLSPPEPTVPPDDRRRRLLGEPGLGPAAMPSDPLEFDVGPGDVLYIPSTWIHWGVSDGDSTTVSLVVNVASAFHALHAQVLDSLRNDRAWWEPLPVGPGSTALREQHLHRLIDGFPPAATESVRERIHDRQGSRLAAKGLYLTLRPVDSPEPAEWIQELADEESRRSADRLVRQCALRLPQTSDESAQRVYAALLRVLPCLGVDTEAMVTSPELAAWLTDAERDRHITAGRIRAEDPLGRALGVIALPELTAHPDVSGPIAVTVPVDETRGLELRRLGLRVATRDPRRRVTLAAMDGSVRILLSETTLPLVSGAECDEAQIVPLAPLERA